MSTLISNVSRFAISAGFSAVFVTLNTVNSYAGSVPTQVSPSTTQLNHANRNNAVCAQQLNAAIIERAQTAQNGAVLSAALDATGLVIEAIGAVEPTGVLEAAAIGVQGLALAGTPGFTLPGVTILGVEIIPDTVIPAAPGTIPSLIVDQQAIDLDARTQAVPYCEQDFVGTVRILNADGSQSPAGPGLDVSGNALFRNNVAVDNTLEFENGIQVTGGPLGQTATAGTPSSIAIGSGANAPAAQAIAVGTNAMASMTGAIAIGSGAQATNVMAVAIGQGAIASGSTAVGGGAVASGANSAAFGMFAMATGDNSTALGENSSATQANTIAVGQGATTTRANQVVVGNTQNTYTTPGIASAASSAAQGTVAGVVTADVGGNLAVDSQLIPTVANNVANITINRNNIDTNRRNIDTNRSGIAMAMALQSPYVPQDKEIALNFSAGFFEDKQAAAMSGAVRVSNNWQFDGGLTVGLDDGNYGGRVGATFTW